MRWKDYMGTDWLQLFDKRRSDRILAMNRQGLTRFLEENLDELKEKDRRDIGTHSSIVYITYLRLTRQ